MLSFIKKLIGLTNCLQAPLALLGRLLLAFIFLDSGYGKILNYSGEGPYMASHGVSPQLLPLVILLELGGGAALVVGLLTRYAALALGIFSIIAAVLFFPNLSNEDQWISFMNNLAICGGMLVLMAFGPGRWSLDARLFGDTPVARP
jgi:putative oxidoreductase